MTVLIPCRTAIDGEAPAGAARLAKAAAEHGWTVRVTYAQAEIKEQVVDSIGVRLRKEPLAAYGLWFNGKFEHAYVWSTFTTPKKLGARALTAFVKGAPA